MEGGEGRGGGRRKGGEGEGGREGREKEEGREREYMVIHPTSFSIIERESG